MKASTHSEPLEKAHDNEIREASLARPAPQCSGTKWYAYSGRAPRELKPTAPTNREDAERTAAHRKPVPARDRSIQ
jgi:hypothetical protein